MIDSSLSHADDAHYEQMPASAREAVLPGSPTYPWPSKEVCLYFVDS